MPERNAVLVVDRNRRNVELMERVLTEEGLETVGATSLPEMRERLEKRLDIGLALIDLAGLPREIWETCEELRNQGVPFLLISPRQSAALRRAGAAHGASAILVKPLAVRELVALVRSLLAQS